MAIPHITLNHQSRKKGQSAIAKVAYNSATKLTTRTGEIADYRRKEGVVHTNLIFAKCAKPVDRQTFWEAVEAREKRKDACVSKGFEFALPRELTRSQRIALAEDFATIVRDRYCFEAVDLAVHEPVKRKPNATADDNPHAHLQFPDRDISGKKISQLSFYGDGPQELIKIREIFEIVTNRHLEQAGHATRISTKKIEEQQQITKEEIEKNQNEVKILEEELKFINKEIEEKENELRRYSKTNVQRHSTNESHLRKMGRTTRENQKLRGGNKVLQKRNGKRVGEYQPSVRDLIDNERSASVGCSQQNRRAPAQLRRENKRFRGLARQLSINNQSKIINVISNIRKNLNTFQDWIDVVAISNLKITEKILRKSKITNIMKKIQKIKEYTELIALGEKINERPEQHQHRTTIRTTNCQP